MSAHTPGPWTVDEDRARDDIVISGGPDGAVICLVVDDETRDPEAVANARLIAAAPDLLAVLERIANSCEEFTGNNDCADPHDLMAAMLQDAREWLDKARGRS